MRPVQADPAQIQQAIINLAVNARDAMPGGGRLTIGTANASVARSKAAAPSEVSPGAYAVLSVADTGTGMDERTRQRLFEPFFTTKGPDKGTGLGLSSVYGVVRQSGGHVRVASEPGQGSTFEIWLPAVEEAAEPERRPAAAEKPPAGTETILLVEDEPTLRRMAGQALGRLGYTVIEARDGAEALRIVGERGHAIQLLLTDVVMPGMSGQELAAAVLSRYPAMKVLCVSGYAESGIGGGPGLDANLAFLQKPFSLGTLSRAVREALD